MKKWWNKFWDKLNKFWGVHGKWSLFLLVASWSFYATGELTRLILIYTDSHGMSAIFQFELAFILLGYITILFIVGLLVKSFK